MTDVQSKEFSVYWWTPEGDQIEERRFVLAQDAVRAARRLSTGPAAVLGMVARVIITDGGDCCCFEWKHGEGVVFPRGPFPHPVWWEEKKA